MGDDVRVRLLSYNVHGLRDDRGALCRTVRALDPDVVFVQEAPRRLRWRSRCAQLARECGLWFGAGGGPAIGNLIMVSQRVRVLGDRSLRFPLTPGRHLRGVALADCELAGRRFVAVGTHLSTDPTERVDQAERLAHVLTAQPVPVLLGADVNEPPGGRAWSRLAATGLRDTAESANPATYPASTPHSRIDAVLVAADCAVRTYEVPDTADVRAASDHRPVYAEVTLPG
ncbi:MAG: endonuclease/exonuclease/phosphatase family protein [Actinocatenispora sp.]